MILVVVLVVVLVFVEVVVVAVVVVMVVVMVVVVVLKSRSWDIDDVSTTHAENDLNNVAYTSNTGVANGNQATSNNIDGSGIRVDTLVKPKAVPGAPRLCCLSRAL